MKLLILLLMVSQSLSVCDNKNDSPKVKGFIVESKFPLIDTINNQWDVREYMPLYTRIYFFKDRIMIQPSFTFINIETANDSIVKKDPEEIRYNSFVFSKNSEVGLFCDSNNLNTARILNKDSMLSKSWVFRDGVRELFDSAEHRLVSSKIEQNGDLIEEYYVVAKKDTTMKGSCTLRFSKKEDEAVYYQLSPAIENDRKLRLIEYTIVNDARIPGPGQMPINRFELPCKLSKLKIENETEILKMFEFAASRIK